ncbi:AT-rich interactive domain-containing protein 5B isoform X2 [Oryzias melastigma]|uniref:Zgc:77151 n=1 Tax=Oryzias melastigma TaxID=30732 RepID=A0A3B3CUK0_ORYME|nr:AT-rich interactive domain-containing protein 5B isoform X2 [Oryzias melastigma]
MEHNAIQWLGAPSCQRGSFSFYKSVSGRARPDGPVRVWRLGEFYCVRCGPQDPVCIAEVTLLWEDQTRRHLLASARLYFLPEDTPKGRTREHGEDEVLAVSRKMVVRVEDLVRWSCATPASWSCSQKLQPGGANGLHRAPPTAGAPEQDGEDRLGDETEELPGVRVLSYPQYCRFRSLQRRIQGGARGPSLQDPHLLALGGVKAPPLTRLMYCRDTFNHPALESSACFSWQFRCSSLSLRGRPRKRRGHDGKDSPNSSQSESWIDRMKENVMGSVEVSCEGSWLPHPEEQLFLDQLYAFMDRHGSPIHKVPNLGFKKIDLFLMYSVVKRLGGYRKVTTERLWKVVYNELGGCPGSTSAATCTRRHYERLMLPYEEHLRVGGAHFKVPETLEPPKPRAIRGRRPLPRGRRPGPKAKERKAATSAAPHPPAEAILDPSGAGVKRGRGRPPGTRNKATLMAQAKLHTQQQPRVQPAPAERSPAANCRGAPTASSTHRANQSPLLPIHLPLTPELSPMSTTFLPFQPKQRELKPDLPGPVATAPTVLLSALPRHFVGGSLSGFSPIKGVCPLDVFRSRVSLQRGPESPALTAQDPAQDSPAVFPLQPKPDSPQPSGEQLHPPHNRCSGCSVEEGGQRGSGRDGRTRPPLPPLRVLPLNLDCSVQVCQLMRTRHLDPTQLQSFTRRLSEALSQDLSSKPPCSPITPPPEQALPLNLSKRVPLKRPAPDGSGASWPVVNGNSDPLSSKRSRSGSQEKAQDLRLGVRSGSEGGAGPGLSVELSGQEEPADLSSPSRIRAFLLGLPPFQVRMEEDLSRTRIGTRPEAESQGTAGGAAVKEEQEEVEQTERTHKLPRQEDRDLRPCPGPGSAELTAGPSNRDTPCF